MLVTNDLLLIEAFYDTIGADASGLVKSMYASLADSKKTFSLRLNNPGTALVKELGDGVKVVVSNFVFADLATLKADGLIDDEWITENLFKNHADLLADASIGAAFFA